jgi:ADP-heptose:LPS heptosyltransferase
LERWKELVSRCVAQTNLSLVLIGGEAEAEALDSLERLIPAARRQVLRGRPLESVAEQLSRCQGFLGHDSGITHLAAAVGIPCLVLWGASNELVWRPGGPAVRTVSHPGGLADLGLEAVWNSFTAQFYPTVTASGRDLQ